jgi:hypothetical protein
MHSTETVVLRLLSDILAAVDKGDVAILVLLDLSAAFNTADHDILLQRLYRTFGIDSAVLQWFRSYLSGRMQYIRRGLTLQTVARRAARVCSRTHLIYFVHCRSGGADGTISSTSSLRPIR